jgi:hypothetical protein
MARPPAMTHMIMANNRVKNGWPDVRNFIIDLP